LVSLEDEQTAEGFSFFSSSISFLSQVTVASDMSIRIRAMKSINSALRNFSVALMPRFYQLIMLG